MASGSGTSGSGASDPLAAAADRLWHFQEVPGASGQPTPPFQSPNLFWRDDRSWCVATQINFYSTYIGASQD